MGDAGKGSAELRAALLDAVAMPAYSLDRQLRLCAFNGKTAELCRTLYGAKIEVGDSFLDVIADDPAREEMRADLERALEGETVSSGQWFGAPPRPIRYFRFTISPTRDDGGSITGIAAIAVDETELQRAREALRVSEDRFAAAFRATPDAININRLSDGRYLEVNPGFTSLTGYSAQDVAGKTSLEISVWADPADRERLVAALQEFGEVDAMEAVFRRKDGSVRPGEMSAVLIEVDGEPCILSVTRDVSEQRRARQALEESYERLARMTQDMVETLGRIVEARDPYTQGHERRAAELCRLIASQMDLPTEEVDALTTAALLHDIGKLSVPAEILTKPGGLSASEHQLVREHPRQGYEILSGISFESPIAEITLEHHERLDGSGYPRGLHGEQIMRAARILAVADVVEAMASHRPYRPSLGMQAAMDELTSVPGRYDADVIDALLELWREGALAL